MAALKTVQLPAFPLDRFEPAIGAQRLARFKEIGEIARKKFAGRAVWNVNSTATGGGVAEILHGLLPYARGSGVDARWVVIEGDAEFFAITKRIHNGLHGLTVPEGPPGNKDRPHYEAIMKKNAEKLCQIISPGHMVILHDPQTAGLVSSLVQHGALVLWRCHIGHDDHEGVIDETWEFLRPYVKDAHGYVFSRGAYAPPWIDAARTSTVAPSIDPFSAKNQAMNRSTVLAIVRQTGLVEDGKGIGSPVFCRQDGTLGTITRRAEIMSDGHMPRSNTPLVVQVSRWDRLKDMLGVMEGFTAHVNGVSDAHLALVGPDISGVKDDPEGAEVLDECQAAWRALPDAKRGRVHLVSLPMDDLEENGAMVNAIQRFAHVVVQKSLYEGFGLTVTEAMWKGRAIVASQVGGIQDQIVNGKHGLLVGDPEDLDQFGALLRRLLTDSALAQRLGRNARRRAIAKFLGVRQLAQYVEIFSNIQN
ncbi:MAG: glycosyltransferase [Myxococcota bacterium]